VTGAAQTPPGRDGGAESLGGGAGREAAVGALDPATREELLALLRGVVRNALGELVAGVAALGGREKPVPTARAASSGESAAGASADGE
jgi:hypothetical protein